MIEITTNVSAQQVSHTTTESDVSAAKMDHSGIKTLSPAKHVQKHIFGTEKTVFALVPLILLMAFVPLVPPPLLYIQMVSVILVLSTLIMILNQINV